jgi:hypothetical protein
MAELIDYAWPEAEKEWETWQSQVGDHPTFLAALARHQVKAGQDDLARATLDKYIKRSADLWAYEQLAELHKKRGDQLAWKNTLDEFLNTVEDHGLDHAKLRVSIANGLMEQGKFAEARPYADKAAATWAGWAMSCAMRCAEAQKDWKAAEGWARAMSERYPDTVWSTWFDFCERTNHGDRRAAVDWSRDYIQAMLAQRPQSPDFLLGIGTFAFLTDDPRLLREVLEGVPNDLANSFDAITLAALADLADQPERRGVVLKEYVAKFKSQSPRTSELCEWIRENSSAKKPEHYDLAPVNRILAAISDDKRGRTAVLMAAHLTALKRPDLARPYWQMVADRPAIKFCWHLCALKELKKTVAVKPKAETPKAASAAQR